MQTVTKQPTTNPAPEGYQRTEVGMIPEDWDLVRMEDICWINQGLQIPISERLSVPKEGAKKYITIQYLNKGKEVEYIRDFSSSVVCEPDDVLMTRTGNTGIIVTNVDGVFHNNFFKINYNRKNVDKGYLVNFLSLNKTKKTILEKAGTSTIPDLNHKDFYSILFPLPTLEEQQAIAEALSDVDGLIAELEALIEKKQQVKKGVMQQLLTGKKRLPGFDGEWEEKKLGDVANCLDNVRIPLNQDERSEMQGNIPYCGANGILDYVDDYVIDDDIILMAEDGGHFDEYATRPIAYRMTGKCWVNNHAHILQAKEDFDQGFLFYSLVHKDITDHITGGTRAKLNKGNMVQIELIAPPKVEEQKAIAQILSDMDAEIQVLQAKRDKYKKIKQGMMQELLTGKTRLV